MEVIARNADLPNSRWYSGAGIYRPVWHEQLPQYHIIPESIRVKTLDWKKKTIEVVADANFHESAVVEILDEKRVLERVEIADGHKLKLNISLPQAELWNLENPRIYQCRIRMGEDVQKVSFGIRTISCDAKDGFLLNGERIIFRGACIHHDNGLLGAVAEPFSEERKIRILKENGYNAIRSAHNPCSEALLNACDQLGMLIVDEYTDMWYIHKTRHDYAKYMQTWWEKDIEHMVRKDYNHPSVIMYSIGNEVSETAQHRGINLCGKMVEYLHELDYRPVTCGINCFFNYLSSLGFGVYSDKKADKECKKKKAVGSEYFNKLAGILGADFMKFGATLPGSDRKTKHAYEVLDVAGYNYGIKRYQKDLKKYPERVILGTETFCSDAYKFWQLAKKNRALIGDFVWSGMDYLGEVGIGAWEYSEYCKDFSHGSGWLTAGAGRIDLTGKPTGEMAYTRVAYELDKIRMAVIPVCFSGQKHSPSAWKMTNAIESWSWQGCEGKKALVEVYTQAHEARLYLNGMEVGRKKRKQQDCRIKFNIPYQAGELKAVAYDAKGKEVADTKLISASEDTILSLWPEKEKITSRQDLCYVRLAYTDKKGIVKPMIHGKIKVLVEGGTLLGVGNGCSYVNDDYLSDTTDTYYGEALAVIRPSGEKIIKIKAESIVGDSETEVAVKI